MHNVFDFRNWKHFSSTSAGGGGVHETSSFYRKWEILLILVKCSQLFQFIHVLSIFSMMICYLHVL